MPETMLAEPCPTSSRLRLARGPVCILSTATADSSDSMLAINATVMTAMPTDNQLPSGSTGNATASNREPLKLTRSTPGATATDNAFERNTVVGSIRSGFVIADGGNTFLRNRANGSGVYDLVDTAGAGANVYEKNKFGTEQPP